MVAETQEKTRNDHMQETKEPTDEKLMLALSKGHLDSAAALFERYHKRIFNFFLRLTGGRRDLSEDLCQNVFERIIRYRASYREGKAFRPWIYQIARNLHYDQAGGTSLHRDDFAELSEVESREQSASRQLEKSEERAQLYRAISCLESHEREVLVLTRFQELKYREVAAILGLTEGAVKVRVHRAIKNLKDQFYKLEQR